ncbi:hypothetical protein ACTQ49_12595 [Luteococcus sp. Sow4_B9]|uniref:hypothetical protein n=1 Tax=Luteococcus sp. Sow4_B9 TaxID=3438792 RepID=UPI003F9BBE1F
MSTPNQPSGQIADPNALLALSRRVGRQYAMYFVLLGLAALVLGFLLFALAPVPAIAVGLVIVGLCVFALGRFVQGHRTVVSQLNHLARPFWVVYVIALVAAVAGTLAWAQHEWIGLAAGTVGLLDGLATGHFVDRASQISTQPGSGPRVH